VALNTVTLTLKYKTYISVILKKKNSKRSISFLDTAESLGIIPLKIKLLDPLKIKIIRNKIINP
jgi:hypothetical protein